MQIKPQDSGKQQPGWLCSLFGIRGARLAVQSVHHRFCHSGLWHETRLVFWSSQRNTSRLTSEMLQSSGNLLGLVLLSFTSKLQKKWRSCKMVFSFAERHLGSSPGSSLADRKHSLSISWLCWGGRYVFFLFIWNKILYGFLEYSPSNLLGCT